MSDQKLRCVVAFRLEPGNSVVLAKFDHAAQYESHGGATSSDLYGNRDKSYADAIASVIEGDPPTGLAEAGSLGGFKVVQSDQHQVVYGADADKICTFNARVAVLAKAFECGMLTDGFLCLQALL